MNTEQRGQALLESLITHIILFAVFFSIVEISRLLAFKSCLQAVVYDIAAQISYAHLTLKKDGIISTDTTDFYLQDKNFTKHISIKIEHSLNRISTAQLAPRVYIRFVNKTHFTDGQQIPAGVYIKVNTCLPVLFTGYFRFLPQKESARDCLGEFITQTNSAPILWFRVRTAAFMPWPATTQIFEKGFASPEEIYGLEKENRKDIDSMLKETDLSYFLTGSI